MKKQLLIILFFPLLLQAQQFNFGLLPEIALSYSNLGRWSVNAKVESMQSLYQQGGKPNAFYYQHRRTDLQFFTNYKLALHWKISAGYQYRVTNGYNAHRLMQQISTVQTFNPIRLGHRLRLDESFYKKSNTKVRIRYRLSAEIALNGSKLDKNEFYFKSNIEVLYGIQADQQDLEGRIGAMLGYYFASRNKMEAGLDYRTDDYLEEVEQHDLWLKIAYYFNL